VLPLQGGILEADHVLVATVEVRNEGTQGNMRSLGDPDDLGVWVQLFADVVIYVELGGCEAEEL
jgi:hypothetical protein